MSFIQRVINIFTTKRSLTIATLVLILIILFFGLRPKTWPNINNVHWSSETHGLVFHDPGFAYVDNLNTFRDKDADSVFSIHILVSVDNLQKRGFRPIVMLHDGSDDDQLTISQWGSSIIVMNGDDYTYRRKLPRISTGTMLVAGEANCITLTSGPDGTRLYSNGLLIQENSDLSLKIPHDGEKLRLVLGNSVYGNHSWEGNIYNLAMYDTQLSEERIHTNCEPWQTDDAALHAINNKNHLKLLFTFETENRDLTTDKSDNNQQLILPLRPLALKQSFLTPPWQNFSLSRNLIIDIVVNLVGFIPLAGMLYVRLRRASRLTGKYPAQATVLYCFILSLIIELSQGWLPGRTSSMLDLILNTSGAALAVVIVMVARLVHKKSVSHQA